MLLHMKKKRQKLINPGQVIIPVGHPNPPELHEENTAKVLARHFKCTVEFLVPIDDFKRKTADIVMMGVEWEIKCPTGSSKITIQRQFQRASQQAKHIVIDLRRTKLDYITVEKSVRFEMSKRSYIKKVILIDKNENVVEFQK